MLFVQMECESNFHIGVDFPFTQNVWLIIEDKLKFNNLWSGETVLACFKTWCLNLEVANIKPLLSLSYSSSGRPETCLVLRIFP